MATIKRLLVELGGNAQSLAQELTKGRKNLNKFAKDAAAAGKKVALALTGIATAVGVGIVAIIERQAGKIDALTKKADSMGMGVEALQRLEYQAELTGVASDKLGSSIIRATRNISEAAQGTGEAAKALHDLGLDAENLTKLSPDKQFYAIAEAMKAIEDPSARVRMAMQIFGREGAALVNTLTGDLEGMGAEFDALGVSITRQQAAAVEAYNDSKTKLATIFGGFFNNVTAEVAPAFQLIIQKITDTIEEMGGVREAAKGFAKGVIGVIRAIVSGAANAIGALGNIEIGWLKIQMAIIAVGEAATDVLNFFTPSVWAQKFGVNFNDTSIQKFNKDLAGTGEMIAGEILKLQQEMAEGPAFQVKAKELLDELESSISDMQSLKDAGTGAAGGTNPVVTSTDGNTTATEENTRALNAAALAQKGASGGAWEKIFGKPKEGKQGDKIDANFSRAAKEYQNAIANGATGSAEAAAKRMKEILESYQKNPFGHSNLTGPRKIGGDWGVSTGRADEHDVTGMKAVMDQLLKGEGTPNMGSINITVKKEDGSGIVSGPLTGEQQLLKAVTAMLGQARMQTA